MEKLVEPVIDFHANQIDFHMKDFARRLALKQRRKVTLKYLFLHLIVTFWLQWLGTRRVGTNHGSYFGKTNVSQKTHGETKRA